MKHKYTVIYSNFFQIGSHSSSTVCCKHIITDQKINISNIEELLKPFEIELTQVNYLFEGHAEQVE